jgi:uncharacterized protein YkwD
MGRHRRSTAAGRAEAAAHSADAHEPSAGGHRHRRRPAYVRTGLLGVSAAVAVGAIAVTAGVLPGGDTHTVGGAGSDQVRPAGTPSGLKTLGGSDATTDGAATSPTASPSRSSASGEPSTSPHRESAKPSAPAAEKHRASTDRGARPTPRRTAPATHSAPTTAAPGTSAPATGTPESEAQAQVLALVNQERASAGCSALTADDGLTGLASRFSKQMADEGFFDHTDPEGRTPWDRAAEVGITNLGGENIARGQGGAAAVMESWMNSPGHRANILNCDYHSIGIGVYFGEGGPWWTQDFGF